MAKTIQQVCGLLDIPAERVLRRASLPPDYHLHETRGLTAQEAFAVWGAVFDETDDPNTPFRLGQSFAHAPLTPASYAFTCSPTVREGLERISTFKQLVGPFRMSLEDEEDGLHVAVFSSDPAHEIPAPVQLSEAVFLIELIRVSTGHKVIPRQAKWGGDGAISPKISDHIGVGFKQGQSLRLSLSKKDAARPLLTQDEGRWHLIERDLHRKLEAEVGDRKTSSRIRAVLLEMLPSGDVSIEGAAKRLHMTPRTLQRHLRAENMTFSEILDDTRCNLALNYLKTDGLSVDEIAHLLGYREPNSFYRAFSNWTGKTPQSVREV